MNETNENIEELAPNGPEDGAAPAEDEAAEAATPEAEPDPIAVLEQQTAQLKDQLLRGRAEFDNYRKRMAKEMEQLRKTAAGDLIRDLLPVADNLARGLDHVEDKDTALAQGVEMVMKQFADVLMARGLEPVPSVGEVFDPNVHEALAQQPSDEHAADVIITEFERGYRLGEQVLRPAKVVVSSGASQPAEQDSAEDDAAAAN